MIADATPDAPMIADATPDAPMIADAEPDGPCIPDGAPDGPVIADAAPDATPLPDAAPDAAVYCAARPPGLAGVYRGTATISDYWTYAMAYEIPPSCSELSARTTTEARLDVTGPPYAVTLTLANPDHRLQLNLTNPPPDPMTDVWQATPSGLSLYHWYPCEGNFASDYYEPATVSIDPSTGAATFHAHCESAYLDSCGFSTNVQTDWQMVLPLTCVPGETVDIGGSAVTCDDAGTVTSSVPCTSPSGPCVAPRPDSCGAGATAFCTTLQTDRDNCGQCGRTCASWEDCSQGACVATCSVGEAACPDAYTGAATVCEDLMSSPYNCGACGHTCTVLESCSGGQCVGCPEETPDRCSTGYGSLSGCANLATDPSNCGFCFHSCSANQTCQAGVCVP
jgi:hypothetical protein